MDIYQFLADHNIPYTKYEHEAVFTFEAAERVCHKVPGLHVKNLFLRNKNGNRHFLVTLDGRKRIDLKQFSINNALPRPSFASPERLKNYLDVTPGSVTPLALINDPDHKVEFYIDQDAWNADLVGCHPLINTATLTISGKDLQRFFEATGHNAHIFKVPEQS